MLMATRLLTLMGVLADVVVGYSGKVLLVSMDGFRWDYINTVPNLQHFPAMAASGCTVDYVNNTFLTKTFPCHYSIVTGLYEETHGIIDDRFYDRTRNVTFDAFSTESFWWNEAEPIWVTAEKNKRNSTAVYFWPGSEAEIRGFRPSIWLPFNKSVPFPQRVDTAISWFSDQNKDFVGLYFEEPDASGGKYGPSSPELVKAVQEMDGILGLILTKLEEKKLADVVNVIVTSDHGMTDINIQDKLIDLWQYVNKSLVQLVPDSGTVTAVLPFPGQEAEVMRQAAQIPHVSAYRKGDIPNHFHYKNNDRIMPIIIISDEGWLLTHNKSAAKWWYGKGSHGYSNQLQSMKPIFFAKGPNFRKGIKSTSISSLDIYPLMCRLLGITPLANNGSVDNTDQFVIDHNSASICCQKPLLFVFCIATTIAAI